MSEKCFCHFNGFQVKDAVARNKMAELEQLMDDNRQAIQQESAARAAAIQQESAARAAAIQQETAARDMAIEQEAAARDAAIQQEAAARTQAIVGLASINISDKVKFQYNSDLSNGADELTKEIQNYNAVYSPSLGIVFFQFSLVAHTGIAPGTVIRFDQNKYKPDITKSPVVHYTYTGADNGVTLAMTGYGPAFTIKEEKNMCMESFNGWYFCAGE